MTIQIDDLVYNKTLTDVWHLPNVDYAVVFSDKTIQMTGNEIRISYLYWYLYRYYPGVPIDSRSAIVNNFSAKTHLRLASYIFWKVYWHHTNRGDFVDVWAMSKLFYEITNRIYNLTTVLLSDYATTVSLHDINEILFDPAVVAAKERYLKIVDECAYNEEITKNAIAEAHKSVSAVLYENNQHLPDNGIIKLTQADLVSRNQILQLIGPRGYLNDIDNRVFPFPVDNGYSEGLTTLYSCAVESRSAARANLMNDEPLQTAEYFNRKVQLVAETISRVEGKSCNEFKTVPYLVRPGDLQLLKGKFHMVDDKPVLIYNDITPYVDKIIQLRSITACGNHNTQTVCATCLGLKSITIPPNANLGYHLVLSILASISQSILSIKHEELSEASMPIILDRYALKYVNKVEKYPDHLFLNPRKFDEAIKIRIEGNYVRLLGQIINIDVKELIPSRITAFPQISIAAYKPSTEEYVTGYETINLNVAGNGISFTTEALEFIKSVGWVTDRNVIEFNFNNWDFKKPIFEIPKRGNNVMNYFRRVESFLQGTLKKKTNDDSLSIVAYASRAKALAALIDILQEKTKINIVQAEVLIRALMAVDPDMGRYELPHSSQPFKFCSVLTLDANRSLSASLSYQGQFDSLGKPHWFDENMPRSIHPSDPIIIQ